MLVPLCVVPATVKADPSTAFSAGSVIAGGSGAVVSIENARVAVRAGSCVVAGVTSNVYAPSASRSLNVCGEVHGT